MARWARSPEGAMLWITAMWNWVTEQVPTKPVQMGTELSYTAQPGPRVNHAPPCELTMVSCTLLSVVPPAYLSFCL